MRLILVLICIAVWRDALAWSPRSALRRIAAVPVAAGLLGASVALAPTSPALAQPAGLSDIKVKSADYGKLADVGVREFLVKNGKQHLRLATPVGPSMQFNTDGAVRKVTDSLELVRLRLEQVGVTNKNAWASAGGDVAVVQQLLVKEKVALMGKQGSTALFDRFQTAFIELSEGIKEQNAPRTLAAQERAAALFNELQLSGLPKKQLPYKLSAEDVGIDTSELAALPQLHGRATVDITVKHKGKGFVLPDLKTSPEVVLRVVVDGYTHPLTAGNFVDLVDRKVYDGVSLKAEELIVQTVKPEGFTPSGSTGPRQIPLETFYKVDSKPTYGITSDDDGRALDTQKLPFQAYGALGMARGDDVDTASADFFFLKWRQALVPPGRNTLDGYYSCFGYISSDNEDLLSQIADSGDSIVSAKVVSGMENLVR